MLCLHARHHRTEETEEDVAHMSYGVYWRIGDRTIREVTIVISGSQKTDFL